MATRLDHVGVAVRSIAEALELYRDELGMEVATEVEVESEQVRVAMLPASGDPAGRSSPRIELLEPSSKQSPVARFLANRGPGIHHIALEVADLDAVVERLRRQGRRLTSNEVRRGAEGYRYVFVHPESTGGVLLELIESARAEPNRAEPTASAGSHPEPNRA